MLSPRGEGFILAAVPRDHSVPPLDVCTVHSTVNSALRSVETRARKPNTLTSNRNLCLCLFVLFFHPIPDSMWSQTWHTFLPILLNVLSLIPNRNWQGRGLINICLINKLPCIYLVSVKTRAGRGEYWKEGWRKEGEEEAGIQGRKETTQLHLLRLAK